ncbi:YebC/PmpR family DNA-binding transcriptional regulator [Francisellaceae bacterium]|nr:YebC/PmpR family DNA-binding transcriptional regulator [Francisellaceae bacterium]
MAGHSKWANIKHKKAAQDAKRGKIFTKLIREITVSARMGGGDPSANPRLRAAIQTALSNNMTRDTIDRAVKKGAGDDDGANVEEIRYEGYAPGGVAIIVDCMTDNRNRTVAEVRHVFTKSGGNLGTDGSVSYLFEKKGFICFDDSVDEDQVMEVAIESGADDVALNDDGSIDVITDVDHFSDVKDSLDSAQLASQSAEITMDAAVKVPLDEEGAQKLLAMVDRFEDLDDVQNVYTNADISDEIIENISG